MDDTLDILVLQAQPHTDDQAVEALEAAGHRVHRCHDEDATSFPCRGALESTACPLLVEPDVALLMRRGVRPQPTALEVGVTCALRAGVPIVELGTDLLDPFAPWVSHRIASAKEAPEACMEAAQLGREPLRKAVRDRLYSLLAAADVDPAAVECTITGGSSSLHVHIDLPQAVTLRLEHAIAVRVLDAIRASGRTYGHIDVSVSPSVAP